MIKKLNLEEPNPDPIQDFIDTVEGKVDISSGSLSPSYPTKRIQKMFSFLADLLFNVIDTFAVLNLFPFFQFFTRRKNCEK